MSDAAEPLDTLELVEALEDGFLVLSGTGEIVRVNGAAERLLGHSRAELVGARVDALCSEPALGEMIACALGEKVVACRTVSDATGRTLSFRIVPRDVDGWLFVREAPAGASSPRTDHLRTVLRRAPVVLFTIGADGVFTMSEGAGLRKLGLGSNELVGRSIFDEYPDARWVAESAREALAGGDAVVTGTVRGVTYEVHYCATRDAAGKVAGAIGVATDVTERERALEHLSSQQAVLEYVISNVPHAIFWKDRQGRFLGGNQNFLDDSGAGSLENLIGKTDYEVWSNREEADGFIEVDQRVMSTGAPILQMEESLVRSDGQQRVLLTSKVPIRDDAGKVAGILGIYADITDRKRMEIELQQAKEAADSAARAKGEFLTMMSHELRTPLALILGPLEELLERRGVQLDGRVRSDLERMRRNASRLHRLVDDILDHQRLAAGEATVRWEATDARELVESIVVDARPAAVSAGVDLRLELPREPCVVPLDRRMFEKIVFNLLGNALKFTPAGGTVTVSLARDGARMQLAVADTGPGIALEDRARVFQRFQQLDSSTTRAHEGSGLGLALVDEFARVMGGRVALESAPDTGSRFTVELPVSADALVARECENAPPARPLRARRDRDLLTEPRAEGPRPAARPGVDLPRVMVVEDHSDMRAYLAELLDDEYDVELAENGVAALRAAHARRPEAIVSDIMMPEMDGYELVRRLKSDPELQDVPIILLSAKASRAEAVTGLDVGADDYLPKPFAREELVARVRAAVRLHRTYAELAEQKRALESAIARLEATQDELVQSTKMAAIGTLVAGLAHELNNPIGIIRASAQLLSRLGLQEPVVRRTIATIERQAVRCASLVTTLLDYSRRTPRSPEKCDLEELLPSIVELARPAAAQRDITIALEVPRGEPFSVFVQRSALESAILNLIGNALDASADGSRIELTVRATERHRTRGVEIVVRDHGSGIGPKDLPHVFEPFFTTKEPGKGTGLGLAMAHRFVQTHEGTISIESEVGRGTTVRTWLPAAVPAESVVAASAPPRPMETA